MAQAQDAIAQLLKYVADQNASDIYLTTGAPPSVRIQGVKRNIGDKRLAVGQSRDLAYAIMTAEQIAKFEQAKELNFAYWSPGAGRFRINVYWQRGEVALVGRYINSRVPDLDTLGLPPVAGKLATLPRGLVLVVGSTGSGKSSTLAAMVNHRASRFSDHILTMEDPIEFLLSHQRSTVDQREIGVDTLTYADALRNALRQAPDMIVIGEIRDRETMQHAISYAETGHLCLSTLHANNANQAIKRILNFYPESAHQQLLMDLSLNLQAVIAQRLLPGTDGRLVLASEVMLRSAYIGELIRKGQIDEIRAAIHKGGDGGMQSFDQCLLDLVTSGQIDPDTALAHAESRTDLGLKLRLGPTSQPAPLTASASRPLATLTP